MMLAQQRQAGILSQLSETGAVRVAELAQRFGVADETIRRDLEKLDRAGQLVRTHGGAVAAELLSRDSPFAVRRAAHHAEKGTIARLAMGYVQEGDVIALDASSTAHELATALSDVPLTVVTNSLPATALLMTRDNIRVLSTGGFLDPGSRSWVGSLAEQAFDRVNINKLFLSSKGVDLHRGLSEVDDAQARVKRRMLDVAQAVYLLVDSSKFGVRSAVHLGELSEVDALLTDANASAEVLAGLRGAGVRVEQAG